MQGNGKFAGRAAAAALLVLCAHHAAAQTFSTGSTGADGAFNVTVGGNTDITVRPGGVYNYTTFNIGPSGIVRFLRNTDNSPVVILVTGDVTISGSLSVSGVDGAAPGATFNGPNPGAAGGPGGFSGGNGGFNNGTPAFTVLPTAGHGPGGGTPGVVGGQGGQGGTYGAPTTFVGLVPLFGGSGGGGGTGKTGFPGTVSGGAGGGGGGAIVIASNTRIIINGTLRANGGAASANGSAACENFASAGTGGAIRLVAPQIVGAGRIEALRGSGGCSGTTAPSDGRIRVEAFAPIGFTGTISPVASVVNVPGAVSPAGNPTLANVPTLSIQSIGGQAVPALPAASYFTPDMALAPGTANPVQVVVTATNTPVGAPTAITVKVIPQSPGTVTNVVIPGTDHTGTFATSSASANVTLPSGQVSVIQAIAAMTLTGQFASLFPLIDGEPVERVTVAAAVGERSSVSLVTRSGREVRVDQLAPEEQLQVARAWDALREAN